FLRLPEAEQGASMLEWYFPWSNVDWVLKVQLLIWLTTVGGSYWIIWRTLIRKRRWLRWRDRR
ncbi:MAG: hypothetical protein V3R81_13395, partial [Gammaproteobacteria bacterium]